MASADNTQAEHVALFVYCTPIDSNHEILVYKPTAPPGSNGDFQIPTRAVGENQTETDAVRMLAEWNLGLELTRLESSLDKSILVNDNIGTTRRCFFHRTNPVEYLKLIDLIYLGGKYEFVPLSAFSSQKVFLPGLCRIELSDLLDKFIKLVAET